jgi:hypothetical protein
MYEQRFLQARLTGGKAAPPDCGCRRSRFPGQKTPRQGRYSCTVGLFVHSGLGRLPCPPDQCPVDELQHRRPPRKRLAKRETPLYKLIHMQGDQRAYRRHSAYMSSSEKGSATRAAAYSSSCPPPSTRTVARRAAPERQHGAIRRPIA